MRKGYFVLIWLARPKILDGPKHDLFSGNGTNGHEQPRSVPSGPTRSNRVKPRPKCSSSFTFIISYHKDESFGRACFSALAFPLRLSVLFLLSCTPQTSLWTVSLLGLLRISFHTFSTTLFHLSLFQLAPFLTFSHTALSAMAGYLFFGIFLLYTLYCHFNFLKSFCFKWVHSQFCSYYCITRRT